MVKTNLSVGFCTSSCNRLWQLKKTLAINLKTLEGTSHRISLIDFGSSDGTQEWVYLNFDKEIKGGCLTFFEVKNNVDWHMSKAKNLAHRICNAEYLFSLDADNFITKIDVEKIEKSAHSNFACHQFSGDYEDGSHGRIGLSKVNFLRLGGYDESMLAMGFQDIDLLKRLAAVSIRVRKLGPPSMRAIQNSQMDKMVNSIKTLLTNSISYARMNSFNEEFSRLKMNCVGPIHNGGYASYSGLLNGQSVIIDGFNNIHFQK